MFYQIDMFPTLTEVVGANNPAGLDGHSILPVLLGSRVAEDSAYNHEFFYWEFRKQYAVRSGPWKAQPGEAQVMGALRCGKGYQRVSRSLHSQPTEAGGTHCSAKTAHEPVRIGTFADPERKDHERDRWAKWGTSGEGPPPRGK